MSVRTLPLADWRNGPEWEAAYTGARADEPQTAREYRELVKTQNALISIKVGERCFDKYQLCRYRAALAGKPLTDYRQSWLRIREELGLRNPKTWEALAYLLDSSDSESEAESGEKKVLDGGDTRVVVYADTDVNNNNVENPVSADIRSVSVDRRSVKISENFLREQERREREIEKEIAQSIKADLVDECPPEYPYNPV